MIKPEELRIGNWVGINNPKSWPEVKGQPLLVTEIGLIKAHDFPKSTGAVSLEDANRNETYSQFNEFIEPIPLTDEWLIKFGFEENGLDKKENKKYRLTWEEGVFDIYRISSFYLDDGKHYEPKIEFIHQLQNLYFALTGTELTLKEVERV